MADEVRALAGRTRAATEDIRNMIDSLQRGSKEAVAVMAASTSSVQETVQLARDAETALKQIKDAIETINNMNIQIASATEEQSLVCEDVNQNVAQISDFARETSKDAQTLTGISRELRGAAKGLSDQFGRFRV